MGEFVEIAVYGKGRAAGSCGFFPNSLAKLPPTPPHPPAALPLPDISQSSNFSNVWDFSG